jgi:uncharacterized protein
LNSDYRMQVLDRLSEVSAQEWNALLPQAPGSQPFLTHEYLQLLEKTGCVGAQTGWQPQHLILRDRHQQLVAAAPLYLKAHSYGEYVFDWSWADAYRRNGLSYYPKLLSAIPFTPITGPRLLARDPAARQALIKAMLALVNQLEVSSLHLLYPHTEDWPAIESGQLLRRNGVQFHWHNQNYAHFEDFLATLAQPKRKKIRAERRKIQEAGVSVVRLTGAEIEAKHWHFFRRCYDSTYSAHGSTPYLNEAFFRGLGELLPQHCLLTIASRGQQAIASSLLLRDSERIYGRYWGALEYVPCLHFELAFYQSIEAAIELGLQVVEGGAQGEHKLARGFQPVQTSSAHWLSEPAFLDAVDRFLARERTAIDGYLDDLNEHTAFKQGFVGTRDL